MATSHRTHARYRRPAPQLRLSCPAKPGDSQAQVRVLTITSRTDMCLHRLQATHARVVTQYCSATLFFFCQKSTEHWQPPWQTPAMKAKFQPSLGKKDVCSKYFGVKRLRSRKRPSHKIIFAWMSLWLWVWEHESDCDCVHVSVSECLQRSNPAGRRHGRAGCG